jgi:UDPglucose 6-dehydrogenase
VVGQATGACLAAIGHEVTYHDVDPARVADLHASGRAVWSGPECHLQELIFICVDTPSVEGAADLSRVSAACRGLGEALRAGADYPVVVLRSTVPPGTTERSIIPWLESASGRKAGLDFGVAYCPEFLRQATAESDARNPWIIVIGRADARTERRLLDSLDPLTRREPEPVPVWVTDHATAEAAKYASNLFNATKISFTNEIWRACRTLGLDGDQVMAIVAQAAEGMWNPRYGIKGGFPFRGGCLPKDAEAFLAFARAAGLDLPLVEAVVRVNDQTARLSPSPTPPPGPRPSSGG